MYCYKKAPLKGELAAKRSEGLSPKGAARAVPGGNITVSIVDVKFPSLYNLYGYEKMTYTMEVIIMEPQKDNDLFFTCSLIDYIARKTKNTRRDVVNALGKERVARIYDLADVYHSDNLDRVRDDFIEEAGIPTGTFDNVAACGYAIPSHWDIGKVYKRLIKQVAAAKNISIVDALFQVYNSFLSDHIDDYNSSVYYENPSYLFESFMAGHILDT